MEVVFVGLAILAVFVCAFVVASYLAPQPTPPPPPILLPPGHSEVINGQLVEPPRPPGPPDPDVPPFDMAPRRRTISMAKREGWSIEIIYCDLNGEWTDRVVSPKWLSRKGHDRRLFGGWCHLRQDDRTFRIDRVRAIEVQHHDPKIKDRYRVV